MNITLGQYYPVNSVIHRLDARLKIMGVMLYIIGIFLVRGFVGYLFCGLCFFAVARLCLVPFKLIYKSLRPIVFIIMMTVVLNLLFNRTGTPVFQWGILKITDYGILLSVRMAVRLVLLVAGSSILTLTTSPIELTVGMEYLLAPFKKVGVPAHDISMMTSIALRFIPTLMEELDKIKKAQIARGADFDNGGFIKKAQSLIPLLVPLFVSSFRRADELALAMEARCYRGDVNRTKMNELKFVRADYISGCFICVFLIVCVVFRFIWSF